MHDRDEGAEAAGQGPDDRQAVDRHRPHPDTSLDEPYVLPAGEGLLEPLQRRACAALQVVVIELSGVVLGRQQQSVCGLADFDLGTAHESADQAFWGFEAHQYGGRGSDGQVHVDCSAQGRDVSPGRQ